MIFSKVTELKGTHNKNQFVLRNGALIYHGMLITKDKLKDILDLVNLLKLEGYELEDGPAQTDTNDWDVTNWSIGA